MKDQGWTFDCDACSRGDVPGRELTRSHLSPRDKCFCSLDCARAYERSVVAFNREVALRKAAPDLLAACLKLLESDDAVTYAEARALARAAVAKAMGATVKDE